MNRFLDGNGLRYLWGKVRAFAVPATRTVNGKALGEDITLTASDVGAATAEEIERAISAAVTGAIDDSY